MKGAAWRTRAAGLAWAGAAMVALRGVSGSINTLCSLAWLRAAHTDHRIVSASPFFVLILPLLREQRVLAGTVGYLTELAQRHGHSVVVLVSTEREHHQGDRAHAGDPGLPSTVEMAGTLAAQAPSGVVRHLHYPHAEGIMVDQVNFAARVELTRLAKEGRDPQRVWVAVYNADSRPDPTTLDRVARLPDASLPPRIVQQSALFTTNLHALPPGIRGAVLGGAALLQSRWTLAREIPRLRRQARQARTTGVRWPYLAHCVGHGLFVRGDEFLAQGGLPTETMNEDLAFGYLACARSTPIDPLPLLEHGESPATLAGLVRQARQWFWSYVEYPRFAWLAAARGLGDRRTRGWLMAQGLARGGLWLGQSPALAATLVLPLLARRRLPALGVAIGAWGFYFVLPGALLAGHERREGRKVPFGTRQVLGGIAAALLSSVGPWWCLANALHRWCTAATYTHDKTER